MVELRAPQELPRQPRQDLQAAAGRQDAKTFKIYRWNPEDGQNPQLDTYESISTSAARWFWTP